MENQKLRLTSEERVKGKIELYKLKEEAKGWQEKIASQQKILDDTNRKLKMLEDVLYDTPKTWRHFFGGK